MSSKRSSSTRSSYSDIPTSKQSKIEKKKDKVISKGKNNTPQTLENPEENLIISSPDDGEFSEGEADFDPISEEDVVSDHDMLHNEERDHPLIRMSEIKDIIKDAIEEHEKNKASSRDIFFSDFANTSRGKKSMNFNVDHIYLTLANLRGPDVTKFWQKWYAMVITSNMNKEDRNESICPDTKDCLDLYADTFAKLDAQKTTRTVPLPDDWRRYENDDFSKLMKSYFYQIDLTSSTSLQSSYEEVSKNLGEKIVTAILGWKDLKHFQSVTETIVNLQKVLKDLQLIPSNHNELISKIMKTMSNKTSDSRTSGSVTLLNNLYAYLMKRSKVTNRDIASSNTINDDIFEFLKQIIDWVGSIVLVYNSSSKLGIDSTPFQQNATTSNNISRVKENKTVTLAPKQSANNGFSNNFSKDFKAHAKKSFNPIDFDPVRCKACGRQHAMGYTQCEIPTHPDLNKQIDKVWSDSDMGKRYASLQRTLIHPWKRLNNEKNGFIHHKPNFITNVTKGNNCIYLNNFDNNSSKSFLSTFSFKNLKGNSMLHFHTLIDSGAIDSNFMSKEAAEGLQAAGYELEMCNSRVEMGVKDLSQTIIGKFKNIEVYFFNFVTNSNESIILDNIFVINSYHELIIGRIPICKFDLFNKLKKDICRDCCSDRH